MKLSTKMLVVAGIIIAIVATSATIYLTLGKQSSQPVSTESTVSLGGEATPTKLDSPYIKEYNLPSGSGPNGITVDKDGIVWIAAMNSTKLIKFDPKTETFEEFKIPTSATRPMMWSMLADRDNKIWFTDEKENAIWRFDPITKEFNKSALPTKRGPEGLAAFPIQLAEDTKSIWFAELYGHKVGVLSKEDPSFIQEFPTPTNSSGPSGLFIREGQVWFTEAFAGKVGMVNLASLVTLYFLGYLPPGAIMEFSPDERIYSPVGIYLDDKGVAWLTEHGASLISGYKISDGTIFRFATTRNENQVTTLPYWIRYDNSGNIWFNEHTGNRVAVFNLTDYKLIEYEVPTRNPEQGYIANVLNLAVAPDGKIWFTEWTEHKIGVLDPSIPIPFDISSNVKEISISRGDSTKIPISIHAVQNFREQLTPRVSSSITPTGKLLNMTATFNPSLIIPSTNTQTIDLIIDTDKSIKPGNYTITVGITDGLVIKSIIINFNIKERK